MEENNGTLCAGCLGAKRIRVATISFWLVFKELSSLWIKRRWGFAELNLSHPKDII
jgi:hypothetical protein